MKYEFRVVGDAWAKPDVGFVPDDQTDFVERSGYRTTEQMVSEMVQAGERLADWRSASYPFPDEFLGVTPVFGDKLDVTGRYEALQMARAQRKAADEAEAAAAVRASEARKLEEAAALAARDRDLKLAAAALKAVDKPSS